MEISAVLEKNSLHFSVQYPTVTIQWVHRQTYPENHRNKEVYQGIAIRGDSSRGCGKRWHRSRSLRHMLLPSLRLLVRQQTRSVPHQLQRRLNSNDLASDGFTVFLEWVKQQQPKHRSERPQSRSRNAQGVKSLGGKAKKNKKSRWSDSTLKNVSSAVTREERILETMLATIPKKEGPTSAVSGWPGEDWKGDSWGLDSEPFALNPGSVGQTYHNETGAELKYPPPDRDFIGGSGLESGGAKPLSGVSTRKSDAGYTRQLEGVLTPLDSPVLRGASVLMYLTSSHTYGVYRRGSVDRTASDRNLGP